MKGTAFYQSKHKCGSMVQWLRHSMKFHISQMCELATLSVNVEIKECGEE